MTGLWTLLKNNQDDFWVNVLAGIPFLVIDLLLLTLLLPWIIDLWDQRRWKRTRTIAVSRILTEYLEGPRIGGRIHSCAERVATIDDDGFQADVTYLQNTAQDFGLRIEMSVQTVIPILGPREVQRVLDFHIGLRTVLDSLQGTLWRIVSNRSDSINRATQILEDIENLGLDSAGLAVMLRKLEDLAVAPLDDLHWDGGLLESQNLPGIMDQALELLAARTHPSIDMSDKARLARARERRLGVNEMRLRQGLEPIKVPVRLYSFDGSKATAPRPAPRFSMTANIRPSQREDGDGPK